MTSTIWVPKPLFDLEPEYLNDLTNGAVDDASIHTQDGHEFELVFNEVIQIDLHDVIPAMSKGIRFDDVKVAQRPYKLHLAKSNISAQIAEYIVSQSVDYWHLYRKYAVSSLFPGVSPKLKRSAISLEIDAGDVYSWIDPIMIHREIQDELPDYIKISMRFPMQTKFGPMQTESGPIRNVQFAYNLYLPTAAPFAPGWRKAMMFGRAACGEGSIKECLLGNEDLSIRASLILRTDSERKIFIEGNNFISPIDVGEIKPDLIAANETIRTFLDNGHGVNHQRFNAMRNAFKKLEKRITSPPLVEIKLSDFTAINDAITNACGIAETIEKNSALIIIAFSHNYTSFQISVIQEGIFTAWYQF